MKASIVLLFILTLRYLYILLIVVKWILLRLDTNLASLITTKAISNLVLSIIYNKDLISIWNSLISSLLACSLFSSNLILESISIDLILVSYKLYLLSTLLI
jgi:hypothetical protein